MIDQDVKFINNIKQVIPLININMNRSDMIKKTGIYTQELYKIIGYIASRGLASKENFKKYIPKKIPNNITSYFEQLLMKKGAMLKNSKMLFNWSINDFYYFFYLPEVQDYIVENSFNSRIKKYSAEDELEQRVRSKIKELFANSSEISVDSVAKGIGLATKSMYEGGITNVVFEEKKFKRLEEYNEIIEEINLFIYSKEIECEIIFNKDIYKHIGRNYHWVNRNYPELFLYLQDKVESANKKIKMRLEVINVEKVKLAVKNLFNKGQPITQKNVAKEASLSRNIIENNEKLKIAINEAKASL